MASESDLQNLAWTMLGEAHPGDVEGMTAVGNTVLNRLAAGNYGSTITNVVKAPNQYAAWGIGNEAAAQANHPDTRFPAGSPQYQAAYDLATQLVNGEVQDNTGGAVNYRQAGHEPSSWGGNTVNIGGNVYQAVHPVSAGTQLIAQEPDASTLSTYASTYGWASLPDANPDTGAPVQTAQSSPADALDAIQQATGQTVAGVPTQASAQAYQAPGEAPAATRVAETAPALPGPSQAPVPMERPPTASADQAGQIALNSVKQWLQGSNVDLSKVPAAQQAALVAAIPTIASLANDPKAELNFLNQSGLGAALTAAVPSHAPNFAENAWASMNGVTLPARLPNDIKDWNLPTGGDVNAAIGTVTNFLSQAQQQRVPNYAPDTGSSLGAASPAGWAQPYTSSPAAVAAGSRSDAPSPSPSPASWAAPYYDSVSNSAPQQSAGNNALSSWASPYYNRSAAPAPQPVAHGADLDSLNIDALVPVPKYITISKQVQVPGDEPIETGDGVHWDPAQQNFVMDAQAPAAATPKMITKTIQQQVPNPAYHAPAPAPVAPPPPQPIAVANGYNYLANAAGGYTNVGQTNPNLTPSQVYAQAAAPALNSQPYGGYQAAGGNSSGNSGGQDRAGGGLTG